MGLNWTDPEGRATGKRIGYMPVGTVVQVGLCRHVNGPPGSSGNYCDVQSEYGVAGKTHDLLIFPMERGKSYAVAIDKKKKIKLYDRIDEDRRRDEFSRNDGTIIDASGEFQQMRTARSEGFQQAVRRYISDVTNCATSESM